VGLARTTRSWTFVNMTLRFSPLPPLRSRPICWAASSGSGLLSTLALLTVVVLSLLHDAMDLPVSERAELAADLLASLDAEP
jgi:hypothetical protein